MKTGVLTILLAVLLNSCFSVSHQFIQASGRAGMVIDSTRDTLVETYSVRKGKRTDFQVYYLNGKRLFIKDFDYHKDGSYKITWKRGHFKKPYGQVYAYYPDGKLWGQVTLIGGLPEGLSRNVYRDGALLGEEPYKRGKLHGTARYYWENGQLFRECEYVKNRLVTIRGSYNKEGKPLPNGNFKNGNGELWRYDDAGEKVEKIEVYKNGKKKKTRKP